jgi:peptide/nickel transport system permease protein
VKRAVGVRLGQAVLVLWLVSVAAFFMVRVSGDPARLIAPVDATEQQLDDLRHVLGLDRPLPVQYLTFLTGALTGDLGTSLAYRQPVTALVFERLPATAELAAAAVGFALIVGVSAGIVAAVAANTRLDRSLRVLSLVGQAMPIFWIGPLLILVFAVGLRWLPASGPGGVEHLVLPAVALGVYPLAQFLRITRAEMLETLQADFVRTAIAKGLKRRDIVIRHAFRNALLPLITVSGLQLGTLLGGAIITETIFAWPGVGQLGYQAVANRDYPVVQGIVLISAAILVLVNFCVDVAYTVADPRTRAR